MQKWPPTLHPYFKRISALMDKPVSVGIAGEKKSGRIWKSYISVMSEYFQV